MKIIHDVLSPELLAHCNGEIDFRLTEESWTFSNNNWDPYLYKGIPGTCLASEVSKGLKLKVLTAVRKHLPLVKHDKYHLTIITGYTTQEFSGTKIKSMFLVQPCI